MSQTKGPSVGGPIEIVSQDPEVMALQAMIKGLVHFNKCSLSMRHLKVLMAAELCIKVSHGRAYPRIEEIATLSRLKPAEFEAEMRDLIEHRYLHEVVPLFGDERRYKIGALGGTMIRRMMGRPAKKKVVSP